MVEVVVALRVCVKRNEGRGIPHGSEGGPCG